MQKINVKNGIDRIDSVLPMLSGSKIGLITNPTGVDKNLTSTIDILHSKGLLYCLFSPEHGIRGDGQAGDAVSDFVDDVTGVTVHSLYNNSRHIPESALNEIDVVAFDIQDVGSRFYTYTSTLFYAMRDCAKNNKKVVVFDRINPVGGVSPEGTVLDRRFSSFVGLFPVATRHNLTVGEYAKYINDVENIGCDLTVVECEGWKRDCFYDETDLVFIPPSPNMPTIDTCLCYVGTCLAEGTNLSEGRGTVKPFEILGAPWLDNIRVADEVNKMGLGGVIIRPCSFTPTFSKYQSEKCFGVQLHITDRRAFKPFETAIRLLDYIRKTHSEFEFILPRNSENPAFVDLLLGTDEWRKDGFDVDLFLEKQNEKLKSYHEKIKEYYIY